MPQDITWTRANIEARVRFWDMRTRAFPVPPTLVDEAPFYCLKINQQWWPHIAGLLEVLSWPDKWVGSDEDVDRALQSIMCLEIPKICEDAMSNCCVSIDIQTQIAVQQFLIDNDLFVAFPSVPETIGTPTVEQPDATISKFASCRAFQEWMSTTLTSFADTAETASALATAWAVLLWPTSLIIPALTLALGQVVDEALTMLAEDTGALRQWACCMSAMMQGQPLSHKSFKSAVCRCETPGGVDFILGELICASAKSDAGWFRFLQLLDSHYEQTIINDVDVALCECEQPCTGEYDFINSMPVGWSFTAGATTGKHVPGRGAQSVFNGVRQFLAIELAREQPAAGAVDVTITFDAAGDAGDHGNSIRLQTLDADRNVLTESNKSFTDPGVNVVTWNAVQCDGRYLLFSTLANTDQSVITVETISIV